MAQRGWEIVVPQLRGIRDRQEVNAIALRAARKKVDRLSRDHEGGGDLPLSHAIERCVQSEIRFVDLHAQTVEHLTAKHGAGAAFLAEINALSRKVRQALDIGTRQQMELFDIKRCDVDE